MQLRRLSEWCRTDLGRFRMIDVFQYNDVGCDKLIFPYRSIKTSSDGASLSSTTLRANRLGDNAWPSSVVLKENVLVLNVYA